MPDFTKTFEDFENELREMHDEIMERCGDEHPHYEQPVTPTCGGCQYYVPCEIEGYEGVGWCTEFGDFYTSDNPFDECWEVD